MMRQPYYVVKKSPGIASYTEDMYMKSVCVCRVNTYVCEMNREFIKMKVHQSLKHPPKHLAFIRASDGL